MDLTACQRPFCVSLLFASYFPKGFPELITPITRGTDGQASGTYGDKGTRRNCGNADETAYNDAPRDSAASTVNEAPDEIPKTQTGRITVTSRMPPTNSSSFDQPPARRSSCVHTPVAGSSSRAANCTFPVTESSLPPWKSCRTAVGAGVARHRRGAVERRHKAEGGIRVPLDHRAAGVDQGRGVVVGVLLHVEPVRIRTPST